MNPLKRNAHSSQILLASVICVIFFTNSFAAELTISPSITISESYTDNLLLSISSEKQSDYITQLNPGIKIRGTGKRLSLSMDYYLQNLFYSHSNEFNEDRHQLSASVNSELLKNTLYLDGITSFTQQAITRTGVTDSENITPTDNLTDVLSYTLTPVFRHNFNATISSSLQYSFGETHYRDRSINSNDATNKIILAELNNSGGSQRLAWSVNYKRTDIDYDRETTADSILERSELETRYAIGRKTKLILSGGYESNNYLKPNANDKTEGPLWGLGLNWRPSNRTSLELITGERFTGKTGSLAFTHKSRKTTLQMSFSEEFTTSSLLQASAPVFDPEGNPVFNPGNPSISTDVFLSKQSTISFSKITAKTLLTLGTFYSKQQSQTNVSNNDEENIGANLNWTWNPGRRTTIVLSENWQKTKFVSISRKDNDWTTKLSFLRKINKNANWSLSYTYTERDSDLAEFDYHRNLFMIDLKIQI